jgi:hypothetical protein
VRRKHVLIGVVAAGIAAGGSGAALAVAGAPDDGEGRVTGPAAERAIDAALRITSGGRVNAVERDGEKGATWEVEVTRPDGKTVDVRLDANFGLVMVDGDSESSDADADDQSSR